MFNNNTSSNLNVNYETELVLPHMKHEIITASDRVSKNNVYAGLALQITAKLYNLLYHLLLGDILNH